jgi:hypothetical protein
MKYLYEIIVNKIGPIGVGNVYYIIAETRDEAIHKLTQRQERTTIKSIKRLTENTDEVWSSRILIT